MEVSPSGPWWKCNLTSFKVVGPSKILKKDFFWSYYCLTLNNVYTQNAVIWFWLHSGTWTIYTFPYRRSEPFIRFSIKVKTQDFWEDDRETINRSREKLVTFGKLSVNFWQLSGKTWNDRLLHFKQNFPSIYIQHKLSRACSEYFSQAINSLLTGWTVYMKNINPSVLPIDLPAVGWSIRQDLGLYIFPYRQSNQLLRRYYNALLVKCKTENTEERLSCQDLFRYRLISVLKATIAIIQKLRNKALFKDNF